MYFLSAEGQTPNVTKAPPYVEFRGLTVTSTDPAKSDESLKAGLTKELAGAIWRDRQGMF